MNMEKHYLTPDSIVCELENKSVLMVSGNGDDMNPETGTWFYGDEEDL